MADKTKAAKKAKIKALKAEYRAFLKSARLVEKELAELTKRRMKKGGGRNKGNANERKLSKQIVAAFASFGVTQKDCYRTPSSGGHRFAKQEDPGDLVISKKLRMLFPFHVEAKHYKDVDLWPFFSKVADWGKSWEVKAWMKQVNDASVRRGMRPLLVIRVNKRPALAVVHTEFYETKTAGLFRGERSLRFPYQGESWSVLRFDRLLKGISKYHADK